MDTTGKAVDSVIQYQLHRDCNGGNESDIRVINEMYLGKITATQEDIDNYGFEAEGNTPLGIGEEYSVYELPVSYNDIENKIVFVSSDEGSFSGSGNNIILNYDNSNIGLYIVLTLKGNWHCKKNNLNLRRYMPLST